MVLDFDQGGGLLGRMDVGCGDGGDGVSLIEDLAAGQNVAADVTERRCAFAQIDDAIGAVGKIGAGDDGSDAGDGGGLAGVDADDSRVCVRTAHYEAVQQPGGIVIGAVKSTARHFVGAIMANRARAHNSVRFHAFTSRISAEACCTARRILS